MDYVLLAKFLPNIGADFIYKTILDLPGTYIHTVTYHHTWHALHQNHCQQLDFPIYRKGQKKREFFRIFLLIDFVFKCISIAYQNKQLTVCFTNSKTELLFTDSFWFYGSLNVTCKKRASQKMLRLGYRWFFKNGPIESVVKSELMTEKHFFLQEMIFN